MANSNSNVDTTEIIRHFVGSLESVQKSLAVLENKIDSVYKIAERTQDDLVLTKNSLQETVTHIAMLNKDFKAVADSCNTLNKTVILGNGVPPLKESVLLLQNWRINTTKSLEDLQSSIDELRDDFDQEKDDRNREYKDDKKESKKNRLEWTLQSIGWIVVIIAVVLEVVLNRIK